MANDETEIKLWRSKGQRDYPKYKLVYKGRSLFKRHCRMRMAKFEVQVSYTANAECRVHNQTVWESQNTPLFVCTCPDCNHTYQPDPLD